MKKAVVSTVALLSLGGLSGQVSAEESTSVKPISIETSAVGATSSVRAQAETQVASVTSLPKPQEGQDHRSSGNFSIENLPNGTYALKFVVEGKHPSSTSFNVKEDKSHANDPTHWESLYSGNKTGVKTSRSFYIANPKGTTSNFIVKVYALH